MAELSGVEDSVAHEPRHSHSLPLNGKAVQMNLE